MVLAYSIESVIAEKFEAIVSLGKANSRMKDFYDIFVLSKTMDFFGERLLSAISETFENRKAKLDVIVAFESGFSADPDKKRQWTSFLKAKKVGTSLSFNDVITQVEMFLFPIADALRQKNDFHMTWISSLGNWKTME